MAMRSRMELMLSLWKLSSILGWIALLSSLSRNWKPDLGAYEVSCPLSCATACSSRALAASVSIGFFLQYTPIPYAPVHAGFGFAD